MFIFYEVVMAHCIKQVRMQIFLFGTAEFFFSLPMFQKISEVHLGPKVIYMKNRLTALNCF